MELIKLSKSQPKFNEKDFTNFLLLKAECGIDVVVVPRLRTESDGGTGAGNLRIKVLMEEEFQSIQLDPSFEPLSHEGNHHLFGMEPFDLKTAPGVLVSAWSVSKAIEQPAFTHEFVESLGKVHGKGFGPRPRSDCFGLNDCRNKRQTDRPHCTPFVAEEDIWHHQCFRSSEMSLPLQQPNLEKKLDGAVFKARQLFKRLNKDLGAIISHFCSKNIATCGLRPPKLHDVLGFVNTTHLDNCDVLKEEQLADILEEANHDPFIARVLSFNGFSLPTTCGHQFVFKDKMAQESIMVDQFFSLDGLGLAVEIVNGIGHHFCAAAFAHRTCLCVVRDSRCGVRITNCFDDFSVFAWGAGGGPRDPEAARRARAAERAARAARRDQVRQQG